ncbi:MAG: hypothetical protein HN849_25770, partial [Victivallales bacterium]|nr:hypothetical protein [Victivallales bacterium]
KWHVYASVRYEGDATEGLAVDLGVYDTEARKGRVQRHINVPELVDGEYHLIDLGTHALTERCYTWIAPPNRTEGVKAVYIDRIFLIREK